MKLTDKKAQPTPKIAVKDVFSCCVKGCDTIWK